MQEADWLQKVVQLQQGKAAEKELPKRLEGVESSSVEPTFDIFFAVPELRSEKDVERFFALGLSTFSASEKVGDLDLATTRLCDLFSGSNVKQAEPRLRLLMDALQHSRGRLPLLLACFQVLS